MQIGLAFVLVRIARRRPGVAAFFARTRGRPKVPQLLAGLRIERGQLAARGTVAAGYARIDDAFVISGRGGDGVAVLPFADCALPDALSRLDVERFESAVEPPEIDTAIADCRPAI